jgi:hypothetical protein
MVVEWHTLDATEPVLKQRLHRVQQFLATALVA